MSRIYTAALAFCLAGATALNAQTVQLGGTSLSFDTPLTSNPGITVGSTCLYDNVATVNGTNYDAIVTIADIQNGIIAEFDYTGLTDSNELAFFSPKVIWLGAGQVDYEIQLIEDGSGSAPIPVTLGGFYVNAYDLDATGAPGKFALFSGYSGYEVGASTLLTYTANGPGDGKFSCSSATANTATADGTTRVRVHYSSVSTLRFSIGASGSGTANYYLDGSTGFSSWFPTTADTTLNADVATFGSFNTFFTCSGNASAAQSLYVEGYNITGTLDVTAPTGYEVSDSAAGTYAGVLNIVPDSTGAVAGQNIYVRMSGGATGGAVDSVLVSSSGAQGIYTTVNGTAAAAMTVSNFTGNNPTACGATDGSITFSILNVVDGAYNVTYNGGSTTASVVSGVATISGLGQGVYEDIQLYHTNGCFSEEGHDIHLEEPIDFTVSYNPQDVEICTGNSASFAVVTDATGEQRQWWEFDSGSWSTLAGETGTAYNTPLLTDTGSYRVVVTSAGGCTWTSPTAQALVHANPAATSVVNTASCTAAIDGSIDLTVTMGVPPISFLWSNGATTEDITGIGSGTYTVQMLDPIGCLGSHQVVVNANDTTAPTAVAQDITVYIDSTGNATITAVDVDGGTTDNCDFFLTVDTAGWNCGQLGAHTVMLVASDSTNTDTAYATVTVADTTAPSISGPADTTFYTTADTAGVTYVWAAPTTADFCTVDSTYEDTTSRWFPIGIHTVVQQAWDAAGNAASRSFTVTVLDTFAPVLSGCRGDTTLYTTADTCGAALAWTAPTATDNSDTVQATASHSHTGTWFATGTTTVTHYATDLSGNMDSCQFNVTVADTLLPVWTGGNDTTDAYVNTTTCNVHLDSVNLVAPTVTDGCGLDTIYSVADTLLNVGYNLVKWYGVDPSGNMDSTVQYVNVHELQKPTIVCPGDTTFYADADSTVWQVTWSGDTAYDNCALDTAWTSIANGSYLGVGITTINYCAVDESGNSDTCQFQVNIIDTIAPVISNMPADTTLSNAQDSCGNWVYWTLPDFDENSVTYTSTGSHTPGDYFPVGTTTVYYTITDAAGYTDSAAFTITIVDTQAPSLVPYSTVTATLNAIGFDTLTVADLDSATTDNCGLDSTWLSQYILSCTDLGNPSIYLYARDASGNVDSIAVSVSVTGPAIVQGLAALTHPMCNGDSTGVAVLTVTGGSAPYNYNWSTGATTDSLTGMVAGSYWYTVQDTNGCAFSDTVVITEPAAIAVSAVLSNYSGYEVSVFAGSDATIDLTTTGGTLPYQYTWNTGATTEDLTGQTAGVYSVSVVDSNGCTAAWTDTLFQPDTLAIYGAVLTHNICPSDTIGAAEVTYSGGAQPYMLTWNTGATTDMVTGLSSAWYWATLIDANGYMVSDSVYVDALDLDCDGILNVDEGGTPGGGNGGLDTDGDGIPNERDTDSDGDGIADSIEFDLDGDGVGFDDCDGDGTPNFLDPDECGLDVPTVMTPNNDGKNDTWEIKGLHQFPGTHVVIFNRYGQKVYESQDYQNDFDGTPSVNTYLRSGSGRLPAGTYYYMVTLRDSGTQYTGYIYINY